MFYSGVTCKNTLSQIVYDGEFHNAHETVVSAELAAAFYTNRWSRLGAAVNLATRFADSSYYHNPYPIPEADLYLMLHITTFPWNRWLITYLAIGEGLSYAADIPFTEQNGIAADDSEKILDFMMFELTLALPAYPRWHLVGRIHHRSGGYGTFAPKDYHAGSNTLGLGIRYYF
jgi:hypothetical protein